MENDGREYGRTKNSFFENNGGEPSKDVKYVMDSVADGKYAICCMNNGANNYWTSSGHFVLLYGYDGDNVYVSDSYSADEKRHIAKENKFTSAFDRGFLFSK